MIALLLAAIIASFGIVVEPRPEPWIRPGPRARAGADLHAVYAVDFLPDSHVEDGSIDYTVHLQRAIDAAYGRTLILPPFALRVLPREAAQDGLPTCLEINSGLRVEGTSKSRIVAGAAGCVVLSIAQAEQVELDGFGIVGAQADHDDTPRALIRAQGGANLVLRRLYLVDADGVAVELALVDGARVEACQIVHPAQGGILASECRDVWIEGNRVTDVRGLVNVGGKQVGAAIEILGGRDACLSSNLLHGGVGAGLHVGSSTGGAAPLGVTLEGNTVRGFGNAANPLSSCGIRLSNGSPQHATALIVRNNRIQDCGVHGIWIDGHAGAVVEGNWICASEWSGIVLARAEDVVVASNSIWNSNTAELAGQAGIVLQAQSRGVRVHANLFAHAPAFGAAPRAADWLDQAEAGRNAVE